ncbi:MAG: ATP-binding cassette domain-containing protein, partial [Planctomycetota bacterium]|nr:ATP-binding cassette domain-containing protein [Planctomycetota bacterium]
LPPEVEPDPRPLGKLEVRGLTFAYAGEREPTIRDLSLTVGPGERVALVGEVGAGKSTLVQLISRLYEPPPGTIFLGGRDVLEIPLDELRRDLGVVPQESFLFSRTIRENVSLRRPQALDEELADAVERAHLATDLDRFPEGLETVVGERGVTLSGGQRQRVALARALMTGPSLLLLDDALSSVDSDTEQAILDRFLKGAGGRGCLFVSHRLSTLAGMDRIVVLKDGRVAEEGTHEALLANEDGAYRRLFLRRQIERSLEEGA